MWFYTFLQRFKLRWWFAIIFLLTFAFAYGYLILTEISPRNGLRGEREKEARFLGMSVLFRNYRNHVGYGDIKPVGISRGLAAGEAFIGLLLAGVLVAKLTSGSVNRQFEIEHATAGVWADVLELPDGTQWFGIVRFTSDAGGFVLSGDNYTKAGERQRTFGCRLRYHDWPLTLVSFTIVAQYAAVQKGTVTFSFAPPRPFRPHRYQVTIRDEITEQTATGLGWKIKNTTWLKALEADVPDPALIRQMYQHTSRLR